MSLKPASVAKLNEAESLYLSAAKARAQTAPWLDALREQAAADFARTGLPHRRVEAWKYTDLRALDRAGFSPAEPGSGKIGPADLDIDEADEIIIRNGFVLQDTLDPDRFKGLKIMSFRTALTEAPGVLEDIIGGAQPLDHSAVYALNLSLMNDGLVLIAEDGASHPRPIVVRYENESNTPTSAHVRNVVIAGKGARITLVESRTPGTSADFLNAVTDVQVGDEAVVSHYRFDQGSGDSLTVMLANAVLGADCRYENVGLSLGGKVARIETHVRFSGEGSHASLGGVLTGLGRDHIDHTTIVRHDVPACSCEEEFRAILADHAQGVFQGQISVAPDAQKTDSAMLMRSLLLSDNASVRAKPELEIYADDVKCSHGTSVGNIDEDAIFYMMSRGIPEEAARALLVEAFSQDVVELITDERVRNVFAQQLADRLARIVGDCGP